MEQVFRMLQPWFAIICGPMHVWYMKTLEHTIYTGIILHMIDEDEWHIYGGDFDYYYDNVDNNILTTKKINDSDLKLAIRLYRRENLREKQVPQQIQEDLVMYIWECFEHEDGKI